MAMACNCVYGNGVCANISKEPNPVSVTEEQGLSDGGDEGFPAWRLYVRDTGGMYQGIKLFWQ